MGKVGEKLEGLESYLWVVLECEEVVRGGGSTAGGGWRRYCAAVAAFRRGVEVMAGPVSFTEWSGCRFGGWLERRRAGEGSSAWRFVRRPWQAWLRGETARRTRQQRAEAEGVRVANEKASSRGFGNGRHGSRR